MKRNIIFIIIVFCIFLIPSKGSALENGNYIISTLDKGNYAVDLKGANTNNKSNIQIYKYNNSKAQQWKITKLTNGYYKIETSLKQNMVLDVYKGLNKKGTNVQLYKYNGSKAQQWLIKENTNGYYNIVSRINGLTLDIKNGSLKNSSNIQIYTKNNSKAQLFNLEKIKGTQSVENNNYQIISEQNENFAIDLKGANAANKSNIQIYTKNNSETQNWAINKLSNGYYIIKSNIDKNKVIDVSNARGINGQNVQLYTYNGTISQQWYLKKISNDTYNIVSRINNKYLTIKGNVYKNSVNIEINKNNNSNSQKFKLKTIEYATPTNDDNSNFSNTIIFAKFSDDPKDIFNATYTSTYTRNNFEEIKKMYNEKYSISNSRQDFKSYIKEVTNNKVNVNNIFLQQTYDNKKVKTYTLKNPKSYYTDGDTIVSEIIDAIKEGKINNNFNNLKLDNLEENILDCLTIIVQGKADDRSDLLTSHKTVYSGSNLLNGNYVRNYVLLSSEALVEDDGSISSSQQQGVISHEFLHVLGLPDLYRNAGSGKPVGPWDIMAETSTFLQYPLGYLRYKQGWIASKEITQSGTYTIDAVNSNGDNQVFILKTPLSDSEYIVLEYRKKSNDMGSLEYKIPSSGLLMYRVDTKVDNLSNFTGNNYIYVYRPDVTNKDSADNIVNGMNAVYSAALDPNSNRNSYGSINLDEPFTNNTLYYSDGTNSGIKISNVKYSDDLKQMTFEINFANYNTNDLWTSLGSISSDVYDKNYIYNDDLNDILYTSYSDSNSKTYVKKYVNNTWSQVGDTISNLQSPKIITYNNTLYLIGRDSKNYHAVTYVYNNGWNLLKDFNVEYAQEYSFIKNDTNLYLYYYIGNELNIYNALTNELINKKTITNSYSNPIAEIINNKIYLTYSDFEGSNKYGVIDSYNLDTKTWTNEITSEFINSNVHLIKKYNNKLYSLIGTSGKKPILYIYDGVSWEQKEVENMNNYIDVSMNIINDEVYITYTDSNKTPTIKIANNIETNFDKNMGTGLENVYTIASNNIIYATSSTKNSSTFTVKKKIIN